MRTALFSAHLMTEHKRKAQASIGAFFSGATNSAAASNKVPRTASSGGKKSEWLKRGARRLLGTPTTGGCSTSTSSRSSNNCMQRAIGAIAVLLSQLEHANWGSVRT
jgi:hypothetical protein